MMIALLALISFAQDPPVLKVLSDLATALSEGNPIAAMATFDKSMPAYNAISQNINALLSQSDVTCEIDTVEQTGNQVEVDWFLLIVSKDVGPTERRQVTVKVTVAQVGKVWKIHSLSPASILDPPGPPANR